MIYFIIILRFIILIYNRFLRSFIQINIGMTKIALISTNPIFIWLVNNYALQFHKQIY